MKSRRLIILVNSTHAGVLDWRPGGMHWLGEFPATEAGLAEFGRVLAAHSGQPVLLVLDSVDEDYRLEVLPHVQGAARKEMLARKLKQVFRNAVLAGAWRQDREPAGRRDDRYLFAAITETDWLQPWLAAIDAAAAPLEGITLMALACQSLLHRLRLREPHILLAYRLNGGLRLSYHQNGRLRFSRLIAGDAASQTPAWAADEIFKTHLYLMGQRMLPREARLHVLLHDPAGGNLATAQTALNADPAFNARGIDTATVARALRVPDEFLASTPAIAPLAAIAGEPLQLDLAPPAFTQRFVDYRWRRGIRLAALGIATAGLAVTAWQWLWAQDQFNQAQRMSQEQQRLETRYREIVRRFPPVPVSAEQLVATLDLARRLESQRPAPTSALAALSRVLDRHPDVVAQNLVWRDAGLTAPAGTGEVKIGLEAELGHFDGNYRAAMRNIENLLTELRALPGARGVSLTRSPVNTDPKLTLSGNTLADRAPPQARFAIEFTHRESP